jgi:hypothetical protein
MADERPAPSERLAAAVDARAAELGMTWQDVWSAGGPGLRTIAELRQGRWARPRPATLKKLDAALRWTPGTAQAHLDGRDPASLNGRRVPAPASDWRPHLAGAGYEPGEIARAEQPKAEILQRLAALGASVSPDQAGDLLFPADPRSAAAWDAAWAASPEDLAVRPEVVAWIVALRDVRRSAIRQGGARGALNPAG